MPKDRQPIPLTGARELVDKAVREGSYNRTQISAEVLGKNPTYLQQWLKYATPRRLPDSIRRKLAAYLRIDEMQLIEDADGYEPILGMTRASKPSHDSVAEKAVLDAITNLKARHIPQNDSAPVRGRTAAGVWMEFDAFDEEKYEAVPYVSTRYGDLKQFAFYVTGNSMESARIFDGDYVVCVDYSIVRAIPQAGDIVVAERRRGSLFERTCKKLEMRDGTLSLVAKSSDPRFKEAVPLDAPEDDVIVEIVGLVVGTYRAFF